jgi:two-component sensor histidine kinase
MRDVVGRPADVTANSLAAADLLLRETHHRCGNDLQLVVSLLGLQRRRARSDETREALGDVMDRVAVLARARTDMNRQKGATLEAALGQVCAALGPHAEPRSILMSLRTDDPATGLSAHQVTTLALVVNELATNAIKHAFEADGTGRITITVGRNAGGDVVVTVDDDGLPFPDPADKNDGLGLGLVRRLTASIGGLLIAPPPGRKTFELRVPVGARRV